MTSDPEGEIADIATEPLPLDAWHRARGARMVEFAGYWMPIQYEGIIAEHLWTRASAGLFDVSHMGQLRVSGDGAAAALEAVLPGDIAGLKPGRIRYSLLLDEEGGILDDLMVTHAGEDFYVVVNGATKWDDIGHLYENLPEEIVLNHMDEHALLALQGPKAVDALARIVPGVDVLSFMQADGFTWNDVPLWISRSGYTGEDGFEISVPAEQVEALADALCAEPEVKPIGLGARDSLRLEAGLPLYGHDLTPERSVAGAGLGFAVSKRRRSEGGFMGAERVLRELADGADERWVGLEIEGRMPAREGATVLAGGRPAGVVTSGGFSPTLERPIAVGWVAASHAGVGTPLEIEVRGKRLAARVVALPFVPHRYVRKGAKA